MLKLSKKVDYGLIAVHHLAQRYGQGKASAKEIARAHGIPQELLAKVLQRLVRKGLLVSQQGTRGGYGLAKAPARISALEVINAINGPVLITSCRTSRGACRQTHRCTVRRSLRKLNDSIIKTLGSLSIASMVQPHA